MSDFERCKECGDFDWLSKHKCHPIFYLTHEYWGERKEIHAQDFYDAAMRFAKKYNENGDYALMDSTEKVVISDGVTEKTFIVSAEPDIHYSAKLVTQ